MRCDDITCLKFGLSIDGGCSERRRRGKTDDVMGWSQGELVPPVTVSLMLPPFGCGAFPCGFSAQLQPFSKTLVTKDVCLSAQFNVSSPHHLSHHCCVTSMLLQVMVLN